MSTNESNSVNEWSNHHAYVAQPLSEYGDSAEDVTLGVSRPLPQISNRNRQGQLQDRATRLLMEKLSGSGRRIRE